MKILIVKNKEEEKFLRRKPEKFDFSKYTRKEISLLIKEMRETMDRADGVGLSANQIGLNIQAFVAKVEGKRYAVFNPEFLKISKTADGLAEGCLSIPEVYREVVRPERVVLAGFDKYGKKIKIKADGLLARVFQHEMDHLNGRLIIDHTKKEG